jgi:hypothetical protein
MLGDRRRQGRLAMINVSDGAHIYMRLGSLKLLLRHLLILLFELTINNHQ